MMCHFSTYHCLGTGIQRGLTAGGQLLWRSCIANCVERLLKALERWGVHSFFCSCGHGSTYISVDLTFAGHEIHHSRARMMTMITSWGHSMYGVLILWHAGNNFLCWYCSIILKSFYLYNLIRFGFDSWLRVHLTAAHMASGLPYYRDALDHQRDSQVHSTSNCLFMCNNFLISIIVNCNTSTTL